MLPHQFRDNAPCQLGSSYGTRTMPLFPRQHNSLKRKGGNKRITGRKARGLQMEEIGCKCQTFLISFKGQEETNQCYIFSPSLSSVQFSRSVMSNSLRPHESQHARPPCPSPTPGVHSNSCPSSR